MSKKTDTKTENAQDSPQWVWARNIAERMCARGQIKKKDIQGVADSLIVRTGRMMADNIERFESEYEYKKKKKWTPEQKRKEVDKEIARLAQLEIDEDDREQLKYDYKQNQGFDIEPDYNQKGKVGRVRLDFKPDEWADLLNAEGEHLHSCCADISRIRDILQDACRNDYYIEVEYLWEAASLAVGHGWDKEGRDSDPISRMIRIWNVIAPDARSRTVDHSVAINEAKEAVELLYQASGVIAWNDIFDTDGMSINQKLSEHATRQRALATMMAAVHTLYTKMKDLDAGPVTGWGIWRDDGEIGNSRSGVSVYHDKKFAEEVCETWNKHAQRDWDERPNHRGKKKGPNHYTVKPTRVSMEKGVELIDEKEIVPYKERKQHKRRKPKTVSNDEID